MQVDFAQGPPAQRGVTTLMSVGDGLVVEPTRLEQSVDRAAWWALGAWIAGLVTGNQTLNHLGRGAFVGLKTAKYLARSR